MGFQIHPIRFTELPRNQEPENLKSRSRLHSSYKWNNTVEVNVWVYKKQHDLSKGLNFSVPLSLSNNDSYLLGDILFSACVSSLRLLEQHCKLRPTIIPVGKEGFKPHHIKLHQCQGTCGDSQPSQKPCAPDSIQEISLDVTDLTSGQRDTVTVFNHTSCKCDCEVINKCKLDKGEMPDEKNCRCIILQTEPVGEGSDNKKGLCA